MELHDLISGELNYTAISCYALRRLTPELKMMLRGRGDWDDILARVQLAAVEAWRQKLDFRDAYNLAQREIHAELRALGFRREWRNGKVGPYIRREIAVADVQAETGGAI